MRPALSQLLVFDTSFSQVEISKGHGSSSEDFHLATTVDALDGYHSAAAAAYPPSPGGAPPGVLRAILTGLTPSSEYNVRVAAISRYDVRPFISEDRRMRGSLAKDKDTRSNPLAVSVYKSSACGGTALTSDPPYLVLGLHCLHNYIFHGDIVRRPLARRR